MAAKLFYNFATEPVNMIEVMVKKVRKNWGDIDKSRIFDDKRRL